MNETNFATTKFLISLATTKFLTKFFSLRFSPSLVKQSLLTLTRNNFRRFRNIEIGSEGI